MRKCKKIFKKITKNINIQKLEGSIRALTCSPDAA